MGLKQAVNGWMERVLFKRVDPIGLAVFRILYSSVLLCEVRQLYTFRHVIYDRVPFQVVGELDTGYVFFFWSLALVCLLIGFHARCASVLNYIFSVIIFCSAGAFEYHMFYVYAAVSFVLMFIPLSATLSVDELRARILWANAHSTAFPKRQVLSINYLAPVLTGIGFVYLDSVLYKFDNALWHKGLGLWLPASLPMMIWYDASRILDIKWLMVACSHLVVLFEVLFVFIFWRSRFRVLCLVLGVLFHLGILIVFPIPWFALGTIALYMLLAPIAWWRRLCGSMERKGKRVEVSYNVDDPAMRRWAVRVRVLDPTHRIELLPSNTPDLSPSASWALVARELPWARLFERWIMKEHRCARSNTGKEAAWSPGAQYSVRVLVGTGRGWWVAVILLLCSFQAIVSWNTPIALRALDAIDGSSDLLVKGAGKVFNVSRPLLKGYFGITHHPLFLDAHFTGYEHLIKVEHVSVDGTRTLLPLTLESGLTGPYVQGSIWAHYGFRINSATVSMRNIEGVVLYIHHFRLTELADPEEGHYEISMKQIEVPVEWEQGFLRRQMEKPWLKVGEYWLGGTARGFTWSQEMLDLARSEAQ